MAVLVDVWNSTNNTWHLASVKKTNHSVITVDLEALSVLAHYRLFFFAVCQLRMGMGCDFHLVYIAVARFIAPFPCLCRAFHVLNRISHVHNTVVSLPNKATAVCFFLLIRPRQVLVGGFDFRYTPSDVEVRPCRG